MSEQSQNESEGRAPAPEQVFATGQPFALKQLISPVPTRRPALGRGRRSQTSAAQRGGHYLRAVIPHGSVRDIALDATLRAAALRRANGQLAMSNEQLTTSNDQLMISSPPILQSPNPPPLRPRPSSGSGSSQDRPFQPSNHPALRLRLSSSSGRSRDWPSNPPTLQPCNPPVFEPSNLPSFQTSILPPDLRIKLRRTRTGNLILFLVDASGSMGARKRMIAVKGAILSLLLDAYQKRDRVGLITFRGSGAQLLVPPTNSVEQAQRQMRQLPTGGRTPLAAGLQVADQVLANYLRKDSALTPLLILITDGRANSTNQTQLREVAIGLRQKKHSTLVLDSEQCFVRLGLAREVAQWLGAQYLPLDELGGEHISRLVKRLL